jgi:hypothetical protein
MDQGGPVSPGLIGTESLFSFLFCAKTKKTVLSKNLLANVVKKHISLIFSPAGKIPTLFSDSQTVVPF